MITIYGLRVANFKMKIPTKQTDHTPDFLQVLNAVTPR